MKIGKIGLDIPKIKRSAKRASFRLDCALGYRDTFQLGSPQMPISPKTPRPKRELEEDERDWIPENPGEVSIYNDPLAIFINRAQKEANPCLTDHEFHKMMLEFSTQGVLGIQEAKEAVGMARDYLSIAHPSSRKMAKTGLEMLKANPKLTPQQLKKSILTAGEKGPAKPAYRVAEFLDEVSGQIPGFNTTHAQRTLSLVHRGKINWYGMEKSLQIIRGKVQESE